MKTKIEIFFKKKLKNFFSNLEAFFDIKNITIDELENFTDKKKLISIVFFDDQTDFSRRQKLKKYIENENFYFCFKDYT